LLAGIAFARGIKVDPADEQIRPEFHTLAARARHRAVAARIETAQTFDDVRQTYA
jgi:EAL domain-containing protein (putative c-di-GMP-specific phosphodiesterase class I)